jgi:hypothetical protein
MSRDQKIDHAPAKKNVKALTVVSRAEPGLGEGGKALNGVWGEAPMNKNKPPFGAGRSPNEQKQTRR